MKKLVQRVKKELDYIPKWYKDECHEEELACKWILYNPWEAYEAGIITYDTGESYVNNTIN